MNSTAATTHHRDLPLLRPPLLEPLKLHPPTDMPSASPGCPRPRGCVPAGAARCPSAPLRAAPAGRQASAAAALAWGARKLASGISPPRASLEGLSQGVILERSA
ncbi:hypothetical protein VE00_03223 [Pseudogymnoascus sp. WSF 3629]|nr:hypothetical protein VE00_03223 [Pseudogymnoascus sp. WSF 3629]